MAGTGRGSAALPEQENCRVVGVMPEGDEIVGIWLSTGTLSDRRFPDVSFCGQQRNMTWVRADCTGK
jgi:hypothetical protein